MDCLKKSGDQTASDLEVGVHLDLLAEARGLDLDERSRHSLGAVDEARVNIFSEA